MKNCEEDKGQKVLPQGWRLAWGGAVRQRCRRVSLRRRLRTRRGTRREEISPRPRVWGVWCILFPQSPVSNCFIHPQHTVLSHPVPYPRRVLSTDLSHRDWEC